MQGNARESNPARTKSAEACGSEIKSAHAGESDLTIKEEIKKLKECGYFLKDLLFWRRSRYDGVLRRSTSTALTLKSDPEAIYSRSQRKVDSAPARRAISIAGTSSTMQ